MTSSGDSIGAKMIKVKPVIKIENILMNDPFYLLYSTFHYFNCIKSAYLNP